MQPTSEWLNQPGGLAERLTLMRKAAGLTQDVLAERIGWARSKVVKLENGRQMPSPTDLRQWADALGNPDAAPDLLRLLEEAQAVHKQWKHQLRRGHPAVQTDFDTLVRAGTVIRNFQTFLIPGLLQTPGYARARAMEGVRFHDTDPGKVEETVAARMRRQEVLYETSKTFEFVIMDAALQYLLCPPDVMRGQLDRLMGVVGLSNITLGIIPPGKELAVTPYLGFLMVDDVVVVETFTGTDTLRGEEAARYAGITDLLLADAVTGDDARELITKAGQALRKS
jgi:transcriptional regulator with XRE-family HTH domain